MSDIKKEELKKLIMELTKEKIIVIENMEKGLNIETSRLHGLMRVNNINKELLNLETELTARAL